MRLTLPRQRGGRFRVGGKERFQPQFRDRDVYRGREAGDRRHQAQLAPAGAELERYREAQGGGGGAGPRRGTAQLRVQRGGPGVGVGGPVGGREQQFVAVAQRQAERLGEPDDNAAAWRRTTALDEAQVPLGGAGLDRELELADPVGAAALLERGREVHVFSNSRSAEVLAIPRWELPGYRPVRKMALMDDTVKLGVPVPIGSAQWGPEADPRTLTGFAMRAKNLGYDSLWVNDFLLTPRIEALTMLAAMAPLTSRVMLVTAALLPVLRPPVQAAQTPASLDLLSGGRLGPHVRAAFPRRLRVPPHRP